jgi:AraC-like DNA-binding protein
MATEQVRMWRPAQENRVLLMTGRTSRSAIEPRGEYVFGTVAKQAMRARRGRQTHLVRPGRLVAWDASAAHTGEAADGRPWESRLMLVEVGDLARLASDSETDALADVALPRPVLSDQALRAGFLRLHVALEGPTTRLERDERLSGWLRSLIERAAPGRPAQPALTPRDDRALGLARDYLGDQPARNIGLDELAAAAGIGKFRLVRLFRERTGLPPHALQVAHRIRIARRMLEAGETVAATAAATGFVDQSHLHRHFKRGLGMTPGAYRARMATDQ